MKKNNILLIIILILIPVFVGSLLYREYKSFKNVDSKKQSTLTNKTTIKETKKITTTIKLESDVKIKINKNNNIEELNLEDYIVGVVAGEMPASFENEALKAQAIASRTYAMYKIENFDNVYDVETTTDDQIYMSVNEMKKKWNEDFDEYYNKIRTAVKETSNLVMKKDNKIFKSYYFAMSNGYTEDSTVVFSENTSKSVQSKWDNESLNNFKVTTNFTQNDLQTKLNILENIYEIKIINRDSTNRISKVQVNNKTYTGIEFRKLLTLRSTDFNIEKKDDSYNIITYGYGHGVGMSQYGANGMAKENYTYQDILKYYYQEIDITNI